METRPEADLQKYSTFERMLATSCKILQEEEELIARKKIITTG